MASSISDREEIYLILARYTIAHGYSPAKLTRKYLYNFFAKSLKVNLPKHKHVLWLSRLSAIIENNQHKEFNLSDYRDISLIGIGNNNNKG